ncbi:MAG: hypothetical protein NT151_04875 [Acidobacteria bacterium]|nr:hypothetical protein [Acidobacteriota bacterium]
MTRPSRTVQLLTLLLAASAWIDVPARAQDVSQKGFLDVKAIAYPQTTVIDDTRIVGEALLRHEVTPRPARWFKLVGALDARVGTHGQTAWDGLDWSDRQSERPSLGVRRLDATISHGSMTFSIGKQFVRWGKTDTINPTDRFAPRDFLTVFDNEYLAVTSARLTAGSDASMIDIVLARFTPSRIPLLDQRWSGSASTVPVLAIEDQGAAYPDRPQIGARWSHLGKGYELSVSGFSGNNHLPLMAVQLVPAVQPGVPLQPGIVPHVAITRVYPQIWMVGGDAAVPLTWFVAKGEVAYFGSTDGRTDEYVLYVLQAERQIGEWLVVAGYAGEAVTATRTPTGFAFDRGLTRAVLGRASYAIDTNRSLAIDAAIRQDGAGHWLRWEFSQARGQHVRVTAQATWIHGSQTNFFGRYNRNSNATMSVRYSY